MTSQALSILSEAMIASNFTHPAMFSGDFEILEQSVAVPNRPGWFSNRSWLHLGGTTGTNEGYAEVTLMGYPTTTNTLEVDCVYTLDGSFIGRKHGSPPTLTYDHKCAVKRGAAPQDLRNRIRISGNAYTAGRVLGDPSRPIDASVKNRSHRPLGPDFWPT
ncbi:hypothetical protein PSTG_02631 [Puccinia striiformis f. sp. tritici PST-78]|uniref:Uncharacterized protein n=1 Tax=Puccinia striiformis f. sp. tritici PST-78 TaxID=1165861 RepID=A0A0L0VY97_9BASI|nr:hypothetical protein PSTG_08631 [Puccinia striiformis f. sp. tritici PST-78]KNF04289.1 hypothetical protein PSTG_02631 [Puccinia striiformis f. sp. tritici PST-78]